MDEYQLEGTIGLGSFSVVKKARHLTSNHNFAIKIVSPENSNDLQEEEGDHLLVYDRRRIDREIGHWRTFQHPNLCHLLRVIEFGKKLAFVMDFAEGGDLLQYLMEKKPLQLSQIQSYFRQLCSAVQYLHSLSLVHGDIKLENILLTEPEGCMGELAYRKVLLSDFGLTRKPPDEALVNCGTIEYAAPELVGAEFEEPSDPFKSDIWALGVVLYALVYRKFPFDAPSAKVMKGRILHHEPEYGEDVANEALVHLIRWLLQKQPGDRPNFEQIFESSFLNF
jgi:serine/threonine protein kinase